MEVTPTMGALQNGGTWENHRKIMDKNMGTILQMDYYPICSMYGIFTYKTGQFLG
jgi:hypothetical protein